MFFKYQTIYSENAWSEVSRSACDTNCKGDVVVVVSSVEMLMLSLYPDPVCVGVYTTRNIGFVGHAH